MHVLQDRLCLVTGAARGIGAAIAEAFLDEGARVILTDTDTDTLADTARRLGAPSMRLDVAREDDWATFAARYPSIDVVVNNAGITGFAPDATILHDPENATLSDWRAVFAVNCDGAFLGCRYALRAMRAEGRGAIVNIASRSGMVGVAGAAAYAASKAALRNLTKSVALHAAAQGWSVRCNAICPGAVLTPLWDPILGHGADRTLRMAEAVADTPLHRFGYPAEVAAAAVWLASDAAAYVTGTELVIDGGITAGAAAPRHDRPVAG